MRILFLGSPEFGVIILKKMLEAGMNVIGVVCAPDKAAGRGNKLTAPPVKRFAQKIGLPVYQFDKIRAHVNEVKALLPKLMVSASFGQILSREILDICPVFNVHPSLLPELRGAAPIQWALLSGLESTGVTIMRTDAGIDSGDIILQHRVMIEPTDNYTSLEAKLALLGGEMIVRAVKDYDKLTFTKQPDNFSYARMLKKDDEFLNFTDTSKNIVNKVRALAEIMGVYFLIGGERFLIYEAREVDKGGVPGEILDAGKRLIIACGVGAVEILEIKAAAGRRMETRAFLNGRKITAKRVDLP